jgi:hypothetical protein
MEKIPKICSPNNRVAIIVGHPCTPNPIPTPTIREQNKIPVQMTPRIGYYVGRQNFINIPTEKVGRDNLINIPNKKTVGVDCTNISPNLLKTPATKHQRKKSKLKITHLNTRSLKNRNNLLHIKQLCQEDKPDILAVSETWLNPQITNAEVKIERYDLYRLDRPHKVGGGVCVYTRPDIKYHQIKNISWPAFQTTASVNFGYDYNIKS